jgi:hypothetical protein
MKYFSFPVIYTTTGWIEIKAETAEAAKKEAERINEEGVNYFSINDDTSDSQVLIDEMEELDEPV